MEQEFFGRSTSLDLIECDLYLITGDLMIQNYINDLVKLLDMKKYGDSNIVLFGEGIFEGYSFTQLIETSLISGHFCDEKKTAYIDIFSCKEYSPYAAATFTKKYFKAQEIIINTYVRK
jgi:S-adenosylmethionine/arginine decarboxylase-like enzyme